MVALTDRRGAVIRIVPKRRWFRFRLRTVFLLRKRFRKHTPLLGVSQIGFDGAVHRGSHADQIIAVRLDDRRFRPVQVRW